MGKILNATLAGLFTGGIITLLVTDKSGKERRETLKAEVDANTKTVKEVKASLENFQTNLTELQVTATKLVPTFKNDINKTIEAFKFQAEPRISDIKETVEKIKTDY